MKSKVRTIALTIVVLTCIGIFFLRHVYRLAYQPVASLSIEQIQAAIQKSGGEEVLRKEAAGAILRDPDGKGSFGFTNCPAITKMASVVGGEIIDIIPDGADGIGVPAHVLIRRGSHFDYQFIYIFGTGSVSAANNREIELVNGPIYLRNTAPKK
jgi:hypothetical protein